MIFLDSNNIIHHAARKKTGEMTSAEERHQLCCGGYLILGVFLFVWHPQSMEVGTSTQAWGHGWSHNERVLLIVLNHG